MSKKTGKRILTTLVITMTPVIIRAIFAKLTLDTIGIIVNITIPIFVWLVAPDRFRQWLKENLRSILIGIETFIIWEVWYRGWLEWLPEGLQIRISWAIGGLLLYSVTLLVIASVLIYYLHPRRTTVSQDKLTYHTIDLLRYSTHYYPRHEPPQGTVRLGGDVKFHILNGHDPEHCHYSPKGIKVQPTRLNQPQVEEVRIDLPNITSVWFLIVARSGHKSRENVKFEGSQIGYIELVFREGLPQRVPLVLGVNIREWDYDRKPEDRVGSLTDKAAREVWRSPDGYSVLDMFQVAVEDGPKDLARIRIVGEFGEEAQLTEWDFPWITIYAITCGQAPS